MMFIVGCTQNIEDDIPNPEIKTITKYVYKENTSKYDVIVQEYNELIKGYNELKKKDFSTITSRTEEMCREKGSSISAPKRELIKKTVCLKNCDYDLYCTRSMLPLFECKDILTVYTNVQEEDIEVCDIIAFKTPEYPKLNWIIHQVININESGYQTKGVNNYWADKYIVQFRDIKFKLIGIEYTPIIDWGDISYYDENRRY